MPRYRVDATAAPITAAILFPYLPRLRVNHVWPDVSLSGLKVNPSGSSKKKSAVGRPRFFLKNNLYHS